MTEDEFKITIRAFFPTLGFMPSDCNEETPVAVSDYLQHDLLGLCKFKFVCGMAYMNDLWVPINTEKYPDSFIAPQRIVPPFKLLSSSSSITMAAAGAS